MRPFILVLMCLAITAIAGCGGTEVSAPTKYLRYQATDGTFSIDYPDDWEKKGGGKSGIQWARFNKGKAEISVKVSFSESAMADIMKGGAGGLIGDSGILDDATEEELEPVAVIHASKKKDFEEEYSGYEEQKAVKITPPLGPGRKSEFTTGGLRKQHGYRASILSNDRGITVVCRCSESDWETLKPAFDKILDGVGRGSGRPQ